MLKLKVLKGLPAQTYNLKEGINIIGRAPTSDIHLNSNGVSKKHAQIIMKDSVCSITDLGSSNGTFVNGAKIQDRILKSGDRIAFHDVLVELTSAQMPQNIPTHVGMEMGSAALNLGPSPEPLTVMPPKTLPELASYYLDHVILPGVYKINEIYPTKNILAVFIILFAVTVTLLSTIPMSALMKDATQKEAQRRALTIARQLAAVSEKSLMMASESSIRTDFAESEEGVTAAMVVSQEDGHIIAPLSKSQSYSNEEFVARARKHDEVYIDQTSSTNIGASVPIKIFMPESGQQGIVAYAIVLYKMNTLDWGATAGLFARVLIISLLVAGLVFFFMYRVIVEPIKHSTKEIDKALRGEISVIGTKYNFEIFNLLLNNINSAISRMGNPQDALKPVFDRNGEASNLTRILTDAAIALDSRARIISVNAKFEELTGMRILTLQDQTLDILQDQALKLNLEDLFQKCCQQPQQIASAPLDMSGVQFELDSQAISDGSEIFYVITTLKKKVET